MSKILNRAILIAGEKKKVGTPIILISTLDKDNKVTRGSGATLPTDGDAGYAVGCIFAVTTGVVGATLYINEGSTTSADFNAVTSGAAGGVSTWDQLYANDKTLAITGTTLTFDGQHATNDVFTLTSTGAGTGSVVQITNAGSGKDIRGHGGTWSFSKTGQAIYLDATIAGTAGSTSWTLTAGDMVVSDGSLAITDADNAATFTITNNTATTASVNVFAGSGVFTGNTTSSFMTLTPSGLTTGTALYLPVAALTEGKALHIVANAVTDGLVFNLTSSSTVLTSTGRLFNVAHTGNAGVSTIIGEFATAAADETILLRLTASAALTGVGAILDCKGVGITTGNGIKMINLDALTSGLGFTVASSATAITGAGRLLYINHTGSTTSAGAGTLNEFATAAADGTNLLTLTASAALTGTMLNLVGNSITATGTGIKVSATALTTGVGISVTASGGTAAITSGSLLRCATDGTGAIITNGVVSFTHTGAFTSTSATNGGFVEIKANSTTAGTIFNLVGSGLTGGIGMQLSNGTSGMTTGSLLRVTASGTGTIATNGIVSITHGGIFVSTSNAGVLDVQASALVGAGTVANFKATAASQTAANIVNIEQSGATITAYTGSMLRVVGVYAGGASTGNAIGVTAANTTAGDALLITNNALTLGAGTLVNLVHGTSVIGAGSSMLRITSTGADTGTTTGCLLDLASSTATAGVLAMVTSATLATGTALRFDLNGLTTGVGVLVAHTTAVIADGGSLLRLSSTSIDTGGATNGVLMDLSSTGQQAGTVVKKVYSALTTGTAESMTVAALTTSGLGLSIVGAGTGLTTGSLLRVSSGTTSAVATNGVVNFVATGAFTSTARQGFVGIIANSTLSGTITSISGTGVTSGTLLELSATAATLTTGRYLSITDDGSTTEIFGIGANGHLHSVVSASGNPTIAVTQQNGITGAAITAGGTDVCGIITTTGTNNNGGTTVLQVTFHKTYTAAPKAVMLMPLNASAALNGGSSAGVYISARAATTFDITIPANASAGATPSWAYFVIA